MSQSPTFIAVDHAGIHAPDPAMLAAFYHDVLDLQLVGGSEPDTPAGASALLASQHGGPLHQLALFAHLEKRPVAFTVESLPELLEWAGWIQACGVPVRSLWNHGSSLSFYVDDPGGNLLELCWPTGLLCAQFPPVADPLDLATPEETLVQEVRRVARKVGPPPFEPEHQWTLSAPLLGVCHVALTAQNPGHLGAFYQEVMGMQVVDEVGPHGLFGASVLLSSHLTTEHHEIAIFVRPDTAHTAFKVASLPDLLSLHQQIGQMGVPILGSFTFGISLAIFFEDPARNKIEIYWPTGAARSLPFVKPIDLTEPADALLQEISS